MRQYSSMNWFCTRHKYVISASEHCPRPFADGMRNKTGVSSSTTTSAISSLSRCPVWNTEKSRHKMLSKFQTLLLTRQTTVRLVSYFNFADEQQNQAKSSDSWRTFVDAFYFDKLSCFKGNRPFMCNRGVTIILNASIYVISVTWRLKTCSKILSYKVFAFTHRNKTVSLKDHCYKEAALRNVGQLLGA